MTMIDPADRGFALGHGLFETVLWHNRRLDRWEAHLDRLTRGCAVIGLPPPDRIACRNAVEDALLAAGSPHRAAVRLNWSAGAGGRGLDMPSAPRPVVSATAAPLGAPAGPARLFTATVRRNDRSPASRLKTLAYLDNVLARAEARAGGADEALMLNSDGEVACAAAANVFWVRDGGVFTPALECGVLDGVVRADVLAACSRLRIPVQEVRARPAQLAGAPMFLTNSLTGVRAVAALDGARLDDSPVVAALAHAVSPEWR
jgi:branched-chain amino acid aminotransferase/4-amino-4-deoxychorismate lyase